MVAQKATMVLIAFGTLIVLQFNCDGVKLCPGDQIVVKGDPVVSLTCQPTGATSEWLRIFHTDLQHTVYNGFDDPYPDGIDLTRCTASRNNVSGALTLNIKDVKPEDALTFGCLDTMTDEVTKATLIVLGSQPVLVRRPLSSSTVEMRCSLKFHGQPVAVNVTWLDRHGHQMFEFNHGQLVQDGIESKVNVSLKNTHLWPAACQVSFSLRRQCGETENIEVKTFHSPYDFIFENEDYTTKTYTVLGVFDMHYPGHFLTAVVCAVILVLVIIVCAQCYASRHRRRRSSLADTETGTEILASSDGNDTPLMKEAITEKGAYEELQGPSQDNPYAFIVQ